MSRQRLDFLGDQGADAGTGPVSADGEQHHIPGLTLDKCGNCRLPACPQNQIAFSMPGNGAVFNLSWTI
jgi:hypothetical protein